MARDITFDILARDKASKTFDDVGRSSDGLGKKLGGLTKAGALAAAAAVGAAAIGGVKFGVDAIKSASDLNETLNKSNVIFGKNATGMEKWADGASKALGLSKSQALDAASGFGDMFLQLGFADKNAALMSKSVVQMSADLGSFNNLPTEDVSQRIAAAFRGEYDSLQALIPNINAARVEKEALAMTGKKSAKQLTAEEKAAATLAIVQKDGARAAGDFAKTSDGLANQQKILTAEFENVKAEVGKQLLPMMTRLGKWFLNDGLPAIKRFGGWIKGDLWPALQKGYQTIMPALKNALSIVTGGVDGGTVSWKKIGAVITDKVIPFLSKLISVYLPVLATNIRTGIEAVKVMYGTFTVWRDVVAKVIGFIVGRFGDLMGVWAGVLRALGKVPGFGWAKDAAAKMQTAADKAHGISKAISEIPNKKTIGIHYAITAGGAPADRGRIKVPGVGYVNAGQYAVGGTNLPEGWKIVGERGPELMWTPGGDTVIPADQTRRALSGGSSRSAVGGGDTFIFYVNGIVGNEQAVVDKLHALFLQKQRRSGVSLGLSTP